MLSAIMTAFCLLMALRHLVYYQQPQKYQEIALHQPGLRAKAIPDEVSIAMDVFNHSTREIWLHFQKDPHSIIHMYHVMIHQRHFQLRDTNNQLQELIRISQKLLKAILQAFQACSRFDCLLRRCNCEIVHYILESSYLKHRSRPRFNIQDPFS